MKKSNNRILTFLIIYIVLASIFLLSSNENKKEETTSKELEVTKEIEEQKIEKQSLSLIMAGDALIHGSVYIDNCENGEYNFDYPLSEIKKIVSNYDLAYYNQETILGGKELGLSHYPLFNSPQEVGDSFVKAGFNLVSLATNHTLDGYNQKGDAYIKSSVNYWKNQRNNNNVIASGSYISQEDRDEIVIGENNGISYALLSYTYGTNGIEVKDNETYLVNYVDKELIKSDVLKYRDKVDLLMVAMHWGKEYTFVPTDTQKELANFLADLDVDIVIGNHAHVIEPIEWIDDTLVIYALGNIISAQYIKGEDMYSLGFGKIIEGQKFSVETLTGMLVSADITKTIENGESSISINNLKSQLMYTDYKDRWKVYPYSMLDDSILQNHEKYFEYFKKVLDNGIRMEIE